MWTIVNTNILKLDTYILFIIFIDTFNFLDLKINVIIKNYVIILKEGGFWMIKYIRPHEIIKMEQFIREPVDLLSKEIIENSSI